VLRCSVAIKPSHCSSWIAAAPSYRFLFFYFLFFGGDSEWCMTKVHIGLNHRGNQVTMYQLCGGCEVGSEKWQWVNSGTALNSAMDLELVTNFWKNIWLYSIYWYYGTCVIWTCIIFACLLQLAESISSHGLEVQATLAWSRWMHASVLNSRVAICGSMPHPNL